MAEAFTAIALADVVLLAYLVTNEHEEVERCLRAIVYLGDLRSEAFPDLDRLSGIMEHDMMLWFQFMADFSEVIKQERLSEESECLASWQLRHGLTNYLRQSGVSSRREFVPPCVVMLFNAARPTSFGTCNTVDTIGCLAASSKALPRRECMWARMRHLKRCPRHLHTLSSRT